MIVPTRLSPRKLINLLDPSMEILRTYRKGPVFQTHKVSFGKDNQKGILKADCMFSPLSFRFGNDVLIERSALKRLKDIPGIPNIIHDFGNVNGYEVILKKYAEGERIPALTNTDSINELETRELKGRFAIAVGLMHERGVIHGDLKHRNVVTSGNEINLIDFGQAKIINDYADIGIAEYESDLRTELGELRSYLGRDFPLETRQERVSYLLKKFWGVGEGK